MNNKIITAILVIFVIVGAVILFSNKPNPTQQTVSPTQTQPSPATQQDITSPTGSQTTQETMVTLTQNGFEPQTVTVKTGTKVEWTNNSGDVATVHSALHPTHLVYPPLNLGQFANGETLSLMFDTPGTYRYHDHLNPTRTGVVVVE